MSHRDLIVVDDDGNLTNNRAYYDAPPIKGHDDPPPGPPPWVDDDAVEPDLKHYTEMELFVAGALSTMKPFSGYHPAWALPFARQAIDAIGDWEPSE